MGKEENKNEKFRRLALSRTNKIIDMVDLLGNLSNRSNYEYSASDVDKIFRAIETSVKKAKAKFSDSSNSKKDKFKF